MWRRPPEERGRGQCRAGAASGEERPGPRGSPRLEGGPDALAVVAGEAAGADLRLLRPPLGRHGAGRPRVPMLPEVRRRGRELGLPGTGPAGPATATATARGFPHAEPRASASRPGARPPETPRSVPSPAGKLGGARPRAPRACMRSLPPACVSASGMRGNPPPAHRTFMGEKRTKLKRFCQLTHRLVS